LRVQKINEALATTVGAAYAISSPSYVEEKFIDENSSADVSYIFVNQATFPDSLVKITPEEMKAYYDKNKQHYKVKDERRAKVLMFPVAASAEDSARAKKRVERLQTELASASTLEAKDSIFTTAVNEYSGIESEWTMLQDVPPQISGLLGTLPEHEVVGPITSGDGIHFYRLDGRRSGANEVVKASHILINFNNNKDSALAFAKKVMGEVNSSNFAAKAMQYSEDKGSATRGGDLGYFGKGRMVPEFEKAAFGAKVGSIVGPIESQFGYHIIKVDDKKSDELKYSDIVFATTISGNTRNKIKRDAFAAMQQIQEGKNIDTLATQLKLQCIESPYVTEDKPLYNSMFLTSRLFEIKQGEVLEPKEIGNGSMVVVAQLSNVRKAGIGTFEDDSVQIKQKLTKIKKLDLAGKRAEEIFNSIKANAALDTTMALPHNLQVKTATLKDNGTFPGMTSDWAGTTYAFSLPENQINAPVRCDNGYFILDIRNRKIATAEQAKDATDLNKANYTRTLFDSWFQSFRDNTKIKDLRNKYYSEY
jgi:parvulin-like peptidyl-prolyl isomerase